MGARRDHRYILKSRENPAEETYHNVFRHTNVCCNKTCFFDYSYHNELGMVNCLGVPSLTFFLLLDSYLSNLPPPPYFSYHRKKLGETAPSAQMPFCLFAFQPEKNASLATVGASPPRETDAKDSSDEGKLPDGITETLPLPKETNGEQNKGVDSCSLTFRRQYFMFYKGMF